MDHLLAGVRRRHVLLLSPAAKAAMRSAQLIADTALRLPGLIMLELYLRRRHQFAMDEVVPAAWTSRIIDSGQQQFFTYLETAKFLEFVSNRNFDQSAAHILRYSVLLLSCLFLLLPMLHLVALYLNAVSFMLLAFAHYMSTRYVQLEMQSGGDIELDDFVKLERHGFHLLAQVMIALTISCLLHIRSDLARASLTVFGAPIVARMCGFPVDKLMVAHNYACAAAMLIICIYLLNKSPTLVQLFKRAYRQLRATLVVRGVATGVIAIWRRLRLPQLIASGWVALWCLRVVVVVSKRTEEEPVRVWEYALMGLSAIADSTATPLSLLGLATTISYLSKFVLEGARICLISGDDDEVHNRRNNNNAAALMQGGYAEALTLVLLCAQTGVLGMASAQRAFLLGLVLFIVLSALLQSILEILEPNMLALGASRHASCFRHVRALTVATFLIVAPFVMVTLMLRYLPLELWSMIITSNCLLTSIQSLSTVVVYALFLFEAHASEPWERLDDMIFYTKVATRCVELAVALLVIAYGVLSSLFGYWSVTSVVVLILHCYFNVFTRLQAGWKAFQMRRQAVQNIQVLAKASREQLIQLRDVCAICVMDMSLEARMTPCGHFFHGACLKKWLFVKQTCPMCHGDLSLAPRRRRPAGNSHDDRSDYSSEWESDGQTTAEENSSDTEYTMPSSDEDARFF